MDFIEENSCYHVGPAHNNQVNFLALDIMKTGIKYKDACHVASAMIAGCQYLITTDKRLQKFGCDQLKIVNPIQFIQEMEEKE